MKWTLILVKKKAALFEADTGGGIKDTSGGEQKQVDVDHWTKKTVSSSHELNHICTKEGQA